MSDEKMQERILELESEVRKLKERNRTLTECFERYDSEDWVDILIYLPKLSELCKWEIMKGFDLVKLFSTYPDLWDKYFDKLKLDMWDWIEILKRLPQFADKCDWSMFHGTAWSILLSAQPQFAKYCNWDLFYGLNWATLLRKRPEFADKCDWDKLDGHHWTFLLAEQPQFADKCDWEKLTEDDWRYLLFVRPLFIEKMINTKVIEMNEKEYQEKLNILLKELKRYDEEIQNAVNNRRNFTDEVYYMAGYSHILIKIVNLKEGQRPYIEYYTLNEIEGIEYLEYENLIIYDSRKDPIAPEFFDDQKEFYKEIKEHWDVNNVFLLGDKRIYPIIEEDHQKKTRCCECGDVIVWGYEGPGEVSKLYSTHDTSFGPVGFHDIIGEESYFCVDCEKEYWGE